MQRDCRRMPSLHGSFYSIQRKLTQSRSRKPARRLELAKRPRLLLRLSVFPVILSNDLARVWKTIAARIDELKKADQRAPQ